MAGNPKLCPGQSTMFWRPEDIYEIPCPSCGKAVEFFKTDIRRTCRGCGTKALNPRVNLSCAEWCAMARDCLGPDLYAQVQEKKDLDRRREADLRALLETVDAGDGEVRALFERLSRENRYEGRLIDTDRLFLLKEEDEALFQKAIGYYSRFVARLKQNEQAK
ncbi:MAG: hypothetical protein A3F84_02775 [Candidatus Handelsmanbacteria bacterium RIFCSPLOWO2_12_FULL_64_10]|uniref:Phosphohydrolase n=1 Tax=Handelsmanbacteria sp. (strain RIFCSPLOWO2_12_FULL_64_10) TaxID=1817868 RepID=A0A1F6CX10_HANXR|nr:MAG: hypothetical protein A3F84_02775 [Candidatus Handelsmanbacteria bacterium RIFCSPLOWO2_12_FULL_64_10]